MTRVERFLRNQVRPISFANASKGTPSGSCAGENCRSLDLCFLRQLRVRNDFFFGCMKESIIQLAD